MANKKQTQKKEALEETKVTSTSPAGRKKSPGGRGRGKALDRSSTPVNIPPEVQENPQAKQKKEKRVDSPSVEKPAGKRP
jgi:hypothetical protein